MRFEILVEGQTELTALSILMPKIIGEYEKPHKWKIHKHRGIGKIPDNPAEKPNKNDQSLLHNLASKLKAYGDEEDPNLIVMVLVDLDDRNDCVAFKNELVTLLSYCDKKPRTLFCIAIEELEAWYLGDLTAIKSAYPDAKLDVFDSYIQDAQIGTWEILADAVYTGGSLALKKTGWQTAGKEKSIWAEKIAPCMNVEENQSPSFQYFRDNLRRIATT